MSEFKNIQGFVAATDFKDLAKQKAIIVKATGGEEALTDEERGELEGLLSFLDAFQDFCVDTLGEPQKRVFPNMTDSEEEE